MIQEHGIISKFDRQLTVSTRQWTGWLTGTQSPSSGGRNSMVSSSKSTERLTMLAENAPGIFIEQHVGPVRPAVDCQKIEIPKSDRLLGSLSGRTGSLVRFFNPRSDCWTQHFCVNEARIDPLTEIGEVTSRMLEFNHPERLAFRRLLMEVGRYLTVEALARIKE